MEGMLDSGNPAIEAACSMPKFAAKMQWNAAIANLIATLTL
jgi:hypothetical protein